jgi:hypothetical protein
MLATVEIRLSATLVPTVDVEGYSETDRTARETLIKDFFTWLQDKRKVRKIVQVIVYDHPLAPCRDEVITSCLEGFDVRYLDWNKEDLSVDMLQKAATNLQELWLTWSGRKTALLGWCNQKCGLILLQKVRCFTQCCPRMGLCTTPEIVLTWYTNSSEYFT